VPEDRIDRASAFSGDLDVRIRFEIVRRDRGICREETGRVENANSRDLVASGDDRRDRIDRRRREGSKRREAD
jgi:hypothetical protein